MKYQLALQWSATSLNGFDALINIENELIQKLSGLSDVDGHDVGADEMNIFIHTNDPCAAFEEVKTILQGANLLLTARVAYREIAGSQYLILWPKSGAEFRIT